MYFFFLFKKVRFLVVISIPFNLEVRRQVLDTVMFRWHLITALGSVSIAIKMRMADYAILGHISPNVVYGQEHLHQKYIMGLSENRVATIPGLTKQKCLI